MSIITRPECSDYDKGWEETFGKKKTRECRKCNGKGVIDRDAAQVSHDEFGPTSMMTCPKSDGGCDGTGQVDASR